MDRIWQFLSRWKTEYDFKTFVSASGSLAATALFALYNGFLGILHASLWHGAICVYYLFLILLRSLIIAAAKKLPLRGGKARARSGVCLAVSVLLLALNLSLVVPIAIMVTQRKPVSMTLIPAIAMAAYTTCKITLASIHLRKRKASSDSLVRLLRTINFIDALVSILTLQNTLIMVVNNGQDLGMLPLTAVSSGAVWAAVLALSVAATVKSVRDIRA